MIGGSTRRVIMKYTNVTEGTFLERPNRFIAYVKIVGRVETVHVKNTGRCKELLIPGVRVLVTHSENPNRKTSYDLIGVYKGELLINMDSQAPNPVVEEWIREGNYFQGITLLKREKIYGKSRFDLYVEYEDKKAYIEVKGVTLEQDGIARFPDAPTLRGIKHVEELGGCVVSGYEAYLIFVIQMQGMRRFEPNWETHAGFGEALLQAEKAGVHLLAYDCQVTPEKITLNQPIPMDLTSVLLPK